MTLNYIVFSLLQGAIKTWSAFHLQECDERRCGDLCVGQCGGVHCWWRASLCCTWHVAAGPHSGWLSGRDDCRPWGTVLPKWGTAYLAVCCCTDEWDGFCCCFSLKNVMDVKMVIIVRKCSKTCSLWSTVLQIVHSKSFSPWSSPSFTFMIWSVKIVLLVLSLWIPVLHSCYDLLQIVLFVQIADLVSLTFLVWSVADYVPQNFQLARASSLHHHLGQWELTCTLDSPQHLMIIVMLGCRVPSVIHLDSHASRNLMSKPCWVEDLGRKTVDYHPVLYPSPHCCHHLWLADVGNFVVVRMSHCLIDAPYSSSGRHVVS